jgi:protocatechuate 3,4-dioxygenase beta subunit
MSRTTVALASAAALAIGAASPAVLALAKQQTVVVGAQGPGAPAPTGVGRQNAGQTGTGFIVGRVLDGGSDRPIPNALVSLGAPAPPRRAGFPPTPGPRSVITDASGQFLFRDLPAGSYALAVITSNTFIDNAYGLRRPGGPAQTLDLRDGEQLGNVTLRVWKPGSISGTITDPSGEPLVETRVSVLRADFIAGRRRFRSAGTTITDDRGMYRVSQLLPGDDVAYLPFTQTTLPLSTQMAAAGGNRSDFNQQLWTSGAPDLYGLGMRIGDVVLVREPTSYGYFGPNGPMFKTPLPGADGRVLVYPLQYFPGASRPADATVIAVESGRERSGVDMQTRLVPGVKISGHINGPEGPVAHVGVRLVSQNAMDVADESAVEAASTITEGNGTFTLLAVPPGDYVLKVARPPFVRASAPQEVTIMGPNGGTTSFVRPPEPAIPPFPDGPTWFAHLAVSIGSADVPNLDVSLQSGGRVTGRVDFDGTLERPAMEQVRRLQLRFEPADGRSFAGASGVGTIDSSGQIRSVPLLPGKYTISVSGVLPDGWRLKSAILNGRDAIDQPLLIDAVDLNGLVLTLTDHPSALSGRVRDTAGNVDTYASVIVFPADRERWTDTGATPRTIRLVRVSPAGAYSLGGLGALPAGEYFVVAIDDQAATSWSDPKRLESLSRVATRLTLGDGEKKSLDLVTAVIR